MTSGDKLLLRAKVSEQFSPATPISRFELLAGRSKQLSRVFDAIYTRGQHAVIFGERGVGKTSLANAVEEILLKATGERRFHVTKVNCSEDDSFASVWRKALARIGFREDNGRREFGYRGEPLAANRSADEFLTEKPSPHEIARILEWLGNSVIIFDEFDRFSERTGLFADTIKTLSDESVPCTLILVGVAQDIDRLIDQHASVTRAISQILMPRMGSDELVEILRKAMIALGMTMAPEAERRIVLLSLGLAHYTHVLGKSSTLRSLDAGRVDITVDDVDQSIQAAVEESQHSIRKAYQTATASPRKDTLFKQVLLACALARVDDLGTFASADVREPLRMITGKPYEIPGFAQHLDKFSSLDRGAVLERLGSSRRFRFRFSDPLLQPFVLMRGLADGLLSEDNLSLLEHRLS